MVSIFPNPCLWRRSLRSNLGGIDLEKLYRATLSYFFSQIKNNIVYKICIYNLRLTSTEKKPNAPHQDFLILRIIFVINENMHESEPHVDLKRLIYHQAIKSS